MLDRNLLEDVTHWVVTPDGFGGYTFGTPIALKGHWEGSNVLFRDPTGDEIVSEAIVYLSADVSPQDYLFLGTSVAADPTTLAAARPVKQFNKLPDLRKNNFARKAFL